MKFLKCSFLLLSALLFASCPALHETSAIDRLEPCSAADGPTDGYCGTLRVWENRDTRTGRKIALRIVVLPALKQESAADPLFVLAGGPGQGAADLAGSLEEQFRSIQNARDVVLIDQRGTGKSNPLECKEARDADSPSAADERLRACLDSYRNRADVTQYTTEIAMDDLDDVRQFLGYSKIDLYGVSYGTRAAMVYVRRHRDHTRAVILDGVAPTDMRLPLYIPRDSQRALDLLFRDCANDIACNQRFPNLKARFNALLVRLDAHPVHARYVDPRTGLEREIDVRRITIARNLLASLYSPLTSATVPLLIDKAEKGDFSGFLAIGTAFDPAWSSMAQGMFFSVVCSEDAPRVTPAALEQEAAGTFLGADMARLRFEPCGFWPRGQVSAGYYANAPSDVPALILSGDLDPVTPPQWGQLVASQWKKSRHIAVPATAHNTAPAGCVMRLISQFLNEGDAASLDASCLQRLKRPPFFVNPSGPEVAK